MTKCFCDKCGNELHGNMKASIHQSGLPAVKIEVVGIEYQICSYLSNDGTVMKLPDLCHYCVIEAFVASDDRPKAG